MGNIPPLVFKTIFYLGLSHHWMNTRGHESEVGGAHNSGLAGLRNLTMLQKERRSRQINYCVNLLNYAGTYYPQSQAFPGPEQQRPPSRPNFEYPGYPANPTGFLPPWLPGEDRIADGALAPIEKYPYQAQVLFHGHNTCSGSILSATHILTLAQCAFSRSPEVLGVRVGSAIRDSGGQVLQVSQVHIHPGFDPQRLHNDLAVLELSSAITGSPAVRPIRPSTGQLPVGTKVYVTGWGAYGAGTPFTKNLIVVDLNVISRDSCSKVWRKPIYDTTICASTIFRGPCEGDYGAPLVYGGLQYGIYSWGPNCYQAGLPGVFTSLSHYRDYLYQFLRT